MEGERWLSVSRRVGWFEDLLVFALLCCFLRQNQNFSPDTMIIRGGGGV